MNVRGMIALFVGMVPTHVLSAAMLSPGSSAPLSGLSALPPGKVLAQTDPGSDQGQSPFLATTVYREDASGCLDFIYVLESGIFPLGIETSVTGFAGFDVDVDYLSEAGVVQHPQSASRNIDGDGLVFGNWVFSEFLPYDPIVVRTSASQYDASGYFTVVFYVETTAPEFGVGWDGKEVATQQTYGPLASAIPEPSPASLLVLASSFAFMRLRGGPRCSG